MNYPDLILMAQEMIAEMGRDVIFYQLDGTPVDPSKPWNGAAQQTPINPVTTRAVFVPVHSLVDLGFISKDDQLLKSMENALICAPPSTGEDLTGYAVLDDSGVRWSIKKLEKLQPGPLTIIYAMGIARLEFKQVSK